MSKADGAPGGLCFGSPGDAWPRPHDNCYWLLPGTLLAGQHPCAAWAGQPGAAAGGVIKAMLDAGIRQWLDLTQAFEHLPDYRTALADSAAQRKLQVQVHRWPITDYAVPGVARMRAILDTLHAALQAGQPLYLHCHGGIGRTGTVVGCLLVEHGHTPDQALALLARKWQVMAKREHAPRSPETDEQRDFIRHWVPGAGR